MHFEDNPSWDAFPDNARIMRNLALGCNMMMSHILHLYHLSALDFVDTGDAGLTKPPFCPAYDNSYYAPATPVAAYLVGQYVKALEIRRKLHQMGALFAGKMPHASMYLPGGVSTKCPDPNETGPNTVAGRFRSLLTDIKNFIGHPLDYAMATTGTYFYDVVAVAHLYPEYFYIGQNYERFLAYGAYEGAKPGSVHCPDDRLCTRGRKDSAHPSAAANPRLVMDHTKIGEFLTSSWYRDYADGVPMHHPWSGDTKVLPGKTGAYSYGKSPRYDRVGAGNSADYEPYEVGPLARMVVNFDGAAFDAGGATWTTYLNGVLAGTEAGWCAGVLNVAGYSNTPTPYETSAAYYTRTGLNGGVPPVDLTGAEVANGDSTLDRHGARLMETYYIAQNIEGWFDQLDPTQKVNEPKKFRWGVGQPKNKNAPAQSYGAGLTEAPRGALGHWIRVGHPSSTAYNGRVTKYQIIVPTTWNVSPKDANGNPGPIEKSIEGTYVRDVDQPLEIMRIVHSFDCCIACTVHVSSPKEGKVGKAVVRTVT